MSTRSDWGRGWGLLLATVLAAGAGGCLATVNPAKSGTSGTATGAVAPGATAPGPAAASPTAVAPEVAPAMPDIKPPHMEEAPAQGSGAATPAPARDGAGPSARAPTPDGGRSLPTKLVRDLNIADEADIAVVLRALAKAGDQNILISRGVEGKINFTFTNVPWDQAFRGVLASCGLTFQWEGDIIRVMTLDDVRRDLEIRKVLQQREVVQADMRKVEPLVLEVFKVRFTSAAKLGETLKQLLATPSADPEAKGPSRSSVMVDSENNTIIVHAIREEVSKVRDLVARLDRPRQQILIEARIVEANSSTARALGVQWGGSYSGVGADRIHTVSSGVGRPWAADFPATLPNDVGFTLGLLSQRFGGGELLNLQLSMLQEDGKINILSSPSITTLDHEPALIESGQERAYRETSGTGNDLDVSIAWKKAVLRLEVTPHIVDNGLLKIEVAANKDSFDETKPESSGEFPVNTKKARTTILLRDGQTTVIGGLSQETRSEAESGIPGLKNIPILGHMFKGRRKGSSMDEILIFLTPSVLPGDAVGARRDR